MRVVRDALRAAPVLPLALAALLLARVSPPALALVAWLAGWRAHLTGIETA